MPDKITGMRVFVQAVRSGSFVAAAEKLSLSPQMVARHISALEKQLGVSLLNRTTRTQNLTATGSDYYQRCVEILTAIEEAERQARHPLNEPAGTLRINSPMTFGRYSLAPLLSDFMQRYPKIRIELTLSDSLLTPSQNGGDLVLRIGEIDPRLRLAARKMSPYRLSLFASPDYLKSQGTPGRPEDLHQHRCLGFMPWLTGSGHQWALCSADSHTDYLLEFEPQLIINDWAALAEAALSGAGIIAGYPPALHHALQQGLVVPVLADYALPSKPMHMLYAPQRLQETPLRLLVDALCAAFPV